MAQKPQSGLFSDGLFSWKSILVFWVLFSFLLTLSFGFAAAVKGTTSFDWGASFWANLLCCILWAGTTPLIVRAADWLPLSGRRAPLHAVLHLIFGSLVAFVLIVVFAVVFKGLLFLTGSAFGDPVPMIRFLLHQLFHTETLYYWFVVLARHAEQFWQRHRQGELAAAQFREQLVNARLENLKRQLQPHFLFNTLHTIGALIRFDEKQSALDVLSELSDLLRVSLDQGQQLLHELGRELAFTEKYLRIEQQRFRDRMLVVFEVEPGCETEQVPPLILQPLVENAVRHALGTDPDAGQITVAARCDGAFIELRVCDDGPGPPPDWEPKSATGIGIANTQARLAALYRGRATLDFRRRRPKGLEVTLRVPRDSRPPGSNFNDEEPQL